MFIKLFEENWIYENNEMEKIESRQNLFSIILSKLALFRNCCWDDVEHCTGVAKYDLISRRYKITKLNK